MKGRKVSTQARPISKQLGTQNCNLFSHIAKNISHIVLSPNDLPDVKSFIGLLSFIWKCYKMLSSRLLVSNERKQVTSLSHSINL